METRRNIGIEEELRALIDEVREGYSDSRASLTPLRPVKAEVPSVPLDNDGEVA